MVPYSHAACSNKTLRPSRLAVAHIPAPVETPNALNSPDFLESDKEYCVTTTKFGHL